MIPSLGTNAPTATRLVGPSYTRRVKHERLVDQIARLAIHHGPKLALVWREALAKRGAEISQGVKLAVFRLAQSTADLRKVISVDRSGAGGHRAGWPLRSIVLVDGHAVFRVLFGPIISNRLNCEAT